MAGGAAGGTRARTTSAGLAAGERAGRRNKAPNAPHGGAGGYFFNPKGHWVVNTQSTHYRNLDGGGDAPAPTHKGPRSVSFQLPCKKNVLPSAFKDKPLCVPAAGRAQRGGGVRNFNAAAPQLNWRRLGISAKKVQEFCVWRNAPMCVLSSQATLWTATTGAEGAPHRVLLGL